MKNLAQPELDLLRSRCLTLCLCWRITRTDGIAYYFTSHDRPLTINGNVYLPNNAFEASAIESKADMGVDNVTMTALTSDDITEQDMLRGLLDNAEMKVFAADFTAANPTEIPLRKGYWGEVTIKGASFEVEVRGLAQVIQQKFVDVYSRLCRADLGDAKCQVNLSDYTVTGTITRGLGRTVFYDESRTEGLDYFKYGLVTFTGGNNNGLSMEVRNYDGGYFTLWNRVPYPINTGDTYTVYAGCDKTLKTCRNQFGNAINFRGEPFIPGEDKALQTPNAKS